MNTPYVDASKKIYDYSDILTDEEENEIYLLFKEFIDKYNMDVVFVSVDLPYSYDEENETYAADFYDYNDFGLDFGKNYDGILLLRNTYESDPYYDIYTFGEAQLYFNDYRYDKILDDLYLYFPFKNYKTGLETFMSDLNSFYRSGVASTDYKINKDGKIVKIFTPPYLIILIVASIITLIRIINLIKRNKMVKKSTEANDYLDNSSVVYNVKNDVFINTYTTKTRINNSSSSSSGGHMGSSHSGSSGGFHSSGGGRHG